MGFGCSFSHISPVDMAEVHTSSLWYGPSPLMECVLFPFFRVSGGSSAARSAARDSSWIAIVASQDVAKLYPYDFVARLRYQRRIASVECKVLLNRH
jgi:hypothetical protein